MNKVELISRIILIVIGAILFFIGQGILIQIGIVLFIAGFLVSLVGRVAEEKPKKP